MGKDISMYVMRGGSEMDNTLETENMSIKYKITPLHGTRPMHPALSKKLYDQNMQSYTRHKIPSVWWQIQYNAIKETVTTINKYTIVELTHNNKHYHGLASRADCDKENAITGIAVAYHRAFKKMMDDIKDDDDLSPIGKAYFKNKDWVSYDLPLKKLKDTPGFKKFEASTYRKRIDNQLKDTVDKQSKLVDKAISDLLACTGVELRQYDLKTIHGAKDALEEIFRYGYEIYELCNTDPLNLTYVLKQHGIDMTQRDIKLTLPTDRVDETQNNLKSHLKSIAKDRSELP